MHLHDVPRHDAARQDAPVHFREPEGRVVGREREVAGATCVKPPPKQKPLTIAMVGFGKVESFCQRHWLEARRAFARIAGSCSVPRK